MQTAVQSAAFYREAVATREIWTIRDDNGFPAPLNPEGRRAQPFWSSRNRVLQVIRTAAAYRGFIPILVGLDPFLSRWLPGLTKDEILVGINWSGKHATGYDVSPEQVAENIRRLIQQGIP